ncbi:putative DNA polymerase sliding clamp [Acanthamoeba polyphaga mimivirus]|nr:putative DNA polymerase sliding clamp [Mimivirus reunion]WMV61855.1 putative DNA polymerase sliding clamp [Mimivirus sp.]WMV62832.1 putative DNA polymerase sliding clamp [Acanthamoeba polyphaga mimivirus]WMV63809.1 putative DNA polymerase sliding clamp [Mimivirus sp.]
MSKKTGTKTSKSGSKKSNKDVEKLVDDEDIQDLSDKKNKISQSKNLVKNNKSSKNSKSSKSVKSTKTSTKTSLKKQVKTPPKKQTKTSSKKNKKYESDDDVTDNSDISDDDNTGNSDISDDENDQEEDNDVSSDEEETETRQKSSGKKGNVNKDVGSSRKLKTDKNARNDNKVLEIRTTQTGALKQVFERVSGVISDCCLTFMPADKDINNAGDDNEYYEDESTKSSHKQSKTTDRPKNTGGIRIIRLTEDNNTLVKVVLEAANFEYFRCDEPKITVGVDMHTLHSHLKMINDDDPIVIYMKKDIQGSLYIRSLSENNDNSEEREIELFLMDIINPEIPVPKTEFQNRITMKSDKFHLICKHLSQNSTFVEITSINNEILFKGQSEGGKVTMTYKDTGYKKKEKPDQVIQGVYELRNLLGFSKCNKLCNTIEIYLKNDFPLVLVISVATLGKMYVFLSPIDNGN